MINSVKKLRLSSTSLLLASSLLMYTVWLQWQNMLAYYLFHINETSIYSEVFVFLMNQFELGLFLILLLGLFSFPLNTAVSRWILFFSLVLALLYLTFDQLFYMLYLDHIRYGFDPEGQSFDPSLLIDSLFSVIDNRFYLNILIVLALCFWNYFTLFKRDSIYYFLFPITLKRALIASFIFAYLLLSFFLKEPSRKEFQNAFFVFGKSLYESFFSSQQTPSLIENNTEDLYTPRFSTATSSDPEIVRYLKEKRNDTVQYNIIYVVMESVGALNLLEGNSVNPSVAPNLYAMRNKSVLFPNLHCFFPSTTRSHIPIISGGNAITYGSIAEINKKYKGPTLISELNKANYRTGLFTAQFMNFESLDAYYQLQDLDKEYMPETMPEEVVKPYRINSWGIDETEPLVAMLDWIDRKNTKPFFAEFMNVGTHHPYSVPENYKGPFENNTDLSRYKNAIHYTDHIIGQLIKALKEKGLYETTIIAISGDHGEAFGDRHYGNYLHKNFLYEENIRNFLLILDPSQTNGPLVSAKKGSIGDIAPTILSYANVLEETFPGQNLLSDSYENKIHYFSKSSLPELWGLLDGDWKFIVQKIENKSPELYNLKEDPFEKNNLAEKYPEQVAMYQKLLPSWYIRKNREYTKYLEGYTFTEEDELSALDVQRSGPKNLLFGNMINGVFTKRQTVHPKEKIFAWTRVVPFEENVHLRYRWISPSGKSIENDFYFDKEWATAWKSFERTVDMEEGSWECQILKGNDVLIKNNFLVSSKVNLFEEYFYTKGPVKLYLGIKDEKGFINLEEMHPDETVMAFSQINPYTENKMLLYEWISPRNKKFSYKVPCEAGWNYTWLSLNEGEPMEEGIWGIRIYEGRKQLLESTFIITKEAKLYQSFKSKK